MTTVFSLSNCLFFRSLFVQLPACPSTCHANYFLIYMHYIFVVFSSFLSSYAAAFFWVTNFYPKRKSICTIRGYELHKDSSSV